MLKKAIQFVQIALSPLLDWKGDMLAYPSRQAWLEKNSIMAERGIPYQSTRRAKEGHIRSSFGRH
jgi:hypothetical protein